MKQHPDPLDPSLEDLLNTLTKVEPSPGFGQQLTARLQRHTSPAEAGGPKGSRRHVVTVERAQVSGQSQTAGAPVPDTWTRVSAAAQPSAEPQASRLLGDFVASSPRNQTADSTRRIRLLSWPAVSALASTAAAACLVFLLHHPRLKPSHPAPEPQLTSNRSTLEATQIATSTPPLIHLVLSSKASSRKASTRSQALVELPQPPTLPTAAQLDQQALEDFHAPSHPAANMFPTQQERLVVLMLRRGERHDLAQLDLVSQSALLERDRAAFHQFFDPPPPKFVDTQEGISSVPSRPVLPAIQQPPAAAPISSQAGDPQ